MGRLWIFGGIAVTALIAAAVLIAQHIESGEHLPMPPSLSALEDVAVYMPDTADFVLTSERRLIDEGIENIRGLSPSVSEIVDTIFAQLLLIIRDLDVFTRSSDWMGDYIAVSLFPLSDGGRGFALSVSIRDREAAEAAAASLSSSTAISQDGYSVYRLYASTVEVLVGDQVMLISNAAVALPMVGSGQRLSDSTAFREAIDAFDYDQYRLLLYLDAHGVVAQALGIDSVTMQNPARYFAAAVAQPSPDILLIDLAQTTGTDPTEDVVAQSAATGDLRTLLPTDQIGFVEIANLRALYEALIISPTINALIPNLEQVLDEVNRVSGVALGLDYATDFVSWMTGDAILFVQPSIDESESFSWGFVAESGDSTRTWLTFQRIGALSLRLDALQSLLNVRALTIEGETMTDAAGQTVDGVSVRIEGTPLLSDVVLGMPNNGEIFVIGNRNGMIGVLSRLHTSSAEDAPDSDPLLPYMLLQTNATIAVDIRMLFANSSLTESLNLPAHPDIPIRRVYAGFRLADYGIRTARIGVLLVD